MGGADPAWIGESAGGNGDGASRWTGPDCGVPTGGRGSRAAELTFGTVVYGEVPFWDGAAGTKRRPAMVVCQDGDAVVVCPITSNSGRGRPVGAYPRLVFWREDGLARPSFLVPHTLTIDRSDVLSVWERLHDAGFQMVNRVRLSPCPRLGSRVYTVGP